jgi:hypothetical protein
MVLKSGFKVRAPLSRGRDQAMLAQLDRTGEDQISLTGPESRAMAAYTKVGVGYDIQVAVDAKNKLIVEQAVTNQVVDMGLLPQTAEPAREISPAAEEEEEEEEEDGCGASLLRGRWGKHRSQATVRMGAAAARRQSTNMGR